MAAAAPALAVNRPQRTTDFYCILVSRRTGLKVSWPKDTIDATTLKKIFRTESTRLVDESTSETLDPSGGLSLKKGETYMVTDTVDPKQIEADLEALAAEEQKNKGVLKFKSNEILDGLWLGDINSMHLHHQMKKEGITHVLSFLDTKPANTPEHPLEQEIIAVPDVIESDLYTFFIKTSAYISAARSSNSGGVLVHWYVIFPSTTRHN